MCKSKTPFLVIYPEGMHFTYIFLQKDISKNIIKQVTPYDKYQKVFFQFASNRTNNKILSK